MNDVCPGTESAEAHLHTDQQNKGAQKEKGLYRHIHKETLEKLMFLQNQFVSRHMTHFEYKNPFMHSRCIKC